MSSGTVSSLGPDPVISSFEGEVRRLPGPESTESLLTDRSRRVGGSKKSLVSHLTSAEEIHRVCVFWAQ